MPSSGSTPLTPPLTPKGRRKNSEAPLRRDLVLDAAEALFSRHGFDGVTVRQVAQAAGVDVALPNYYFESKQGLYDAVFGRRALILNDMREDSLRKVLDGETAPSLEQILRAFIEPVQVMHAAADPGWRHYCRLVAQVNSSSVLSPMMTSHFDRLILKFIGALRQALPHVNDRELYWGYHSLSGGLTLTMASTGRIDHLSGGLCHSDDAADAYGHLISYHTGAFQALESRALEDRARNA
ncbi:MAG: TetR family transcriptional regulator [Asticcacaulis sp.]